MSDKPQTFENHARFVPLFHFVALPILVFNVLSRLYRVFASPGMDSVVALLVSVALLLVAFYARAFALTAQDRIIRLEMRLRLREVLPADLQPRIGDFTVGQLVSLRFASDDELPALAKRVLDEHLTTRRAIKRLVRNWRADTLRV